MIQVLAIFMWSLMGADGEQWDYNLAETSAELLEHCNLARGGCADPRTHTAWVLEENRYMASNKPCLTMEDHELAHVIGLNHGQMASLCMLSEMSKYHLMYPTNNIEHLRQMALH